MTLIVGRGASPWKKKRAIVAASSTAAVHTVPLTKFRTIQYVITLYNTTEDKTKSMNLLVHQEGGALTNTVWARIGKNLTLKVTTELVSGSMELTVENSELFPLTVEVGYLILK